ncbi:sialic acid-binding Ig-like lectin 12 isoform X4 [Epinephelus fuscoguttatus]|uniref:sialic acid-binding Ig-like lectin 12 isoform X4 n=1 Tax=Epinephelus fuscoguttatus TaxID=293821 RepID=UPI0020D00A59|nr:sialic acid-binding Ig-like lectin 12 isoform X4 [Epinephelus fuscoguttatus]
MAALSVSIVTFNMLLHILFLSGALAACPYVSHLFITAPQEMEALSGSCLQIPCNFSLVPEQNIVSTEIVGIWIKKHRNHRHTNNVIFDSSKTVNDYPMNITGNLSERNCTTLFSNLIISYTDTYYFRFENRDTSEYKATAACDPLQITVRDSPPSPRIEISGDLREKESVTITCSASTPCPHSPPKLTWNLTQHPHNTIEENTDRTLTTKIQETITLSDKHDGVTITCSATYPVDGGNYKTAEEEMTLNVSYAPKNTSVSISPSGLVSAGSWVNLTCSSRANPPVSSFTWFKTSNDGPIKVSEGDFYSFNVTDGGVYYCVATNDLGNETSSKIHLTVKAESPDGSLQWKLILGGIIGIIVLICLVLCVCTLVCWRRVKSTHSTQQQSQSQTGVEMAVEKPARQPEDKKEEDIHYGEIDFSQQRSKPSAASVHDSEGQQDTLYAQVNVSEPANTLTPTADGPEDLYAQVKKK